jgi:transcriptional adapter 2-alpha
MYANKNKSVNNIYNELNDEDVDVNQNSNTNFHRKAEKKLREIEKLESKPGIYLTDEEIKKINDKFFWQSVLYPEKKNIFFEPTKKEKEKIEKKRIKIEREKIAREKEREKEREREREKEREKERIKRKNSNLIKVSDLELEYKKEFLKNNSNNDKTFRQLSLKYHPDKNVSNPVWAQEKQQELLDIKNKYEKD